MKVSIGQVTSGTDKEANINAIAESAKKAAAEGASLIVFPEFSMYKQPAADENFIKAGENLDGPFVTALKRIARENSINIAAGMTEHIDTENRVFNTIAVISKEGQLLGTYRKLHLYDSFGGQESKWVRPGSCDQNHVFEIEGIKFGFATCYDLRFPEIARWLVDQGAEAIVLPTAWTPGLRKDDHWNTLTRARAIENTAYFVAADLAPPFCPGGSLIIDPMGVILAQAPETAAVITAEISKDRVLEVRKKNPALEHRRFKVVPA